jgi:hypothetical protein
MLLALAHARMLFSEHNDRSQQTNYDSYGYQKNKIAQPAVGVPMV